MAEVSPSYPYDVALSFAGEDRIYAEQLAELLNAQGVKVFYDRYEQAQLWGMDLYGHLADVYFKQARYCVMFISTNYERKLWTNHERKGAQARAFQQKDPYILPIKLDDTIIPGIPETIGYIDLRHSSIEDIAAMVLAKLDRQPRNNGALTPSANPVGQASKERKIPMPNIKRTFNDFEKDQFLENSFVEIRDYFNEALSHLEAQSSDIKTSFTDIHNLKFICKIYIHGNLNTQCKIWLGGSFRSDTINYVEGNFDINQDNSLNDYLQVNDDNGTLSLQISMMGLGLGSSVGENVSPQEAAEYLWKRFTSRLSQ